MKKQNLNNKEIKRATSYKRTQEVIKCLEVIIKDKQKKKEAISVVRALDGKKLEILLECSVNKLQAV